MPSFPVLSPDAVPEAILRLLASSIVLVVAVITARWVVARVIRRSVPASEMRRRWLVHTRNLMLLVLVLGLILIWGAELRPLALSIVAVAVATVIATKELILCVSGSILKTGARSFSIGDRIQIKDFRGDVIDQNLLATTIMEIGPGKLTHQRTGRIAVIPNALFLSEPVINESFTNDYVLHVFTVPFRREDDWRAAQQALLEGARKVCAPYLEDARKHMNRISEEQSLDAPSVDPRVTISTPMPGEIHLVVRLPAKSPQRGFVEQGVLAELFAKGDYAPPQPVGPEQARPGNDHGDRKP